MRYVELCEAPIGDLEVHGMDAPGTFPDADRRLLRNPDHLQKIRRRFANTDVDFNLYFVNQPDKTYVVGNDPARSRDFSATWFKDRAAYSGYTDTTTIKTVTGLTVLPDPARITMVLLSNANTENTISMTPWIIAHRFGHVLTDFPKNLPNGLGAALARLPTRDTSIVEFEYRTGTLETLRVGQVLTMRSARTGLLTAGDEVEELIAQYLMQGMIVFKVPDALRAKMKDPARVDVAVNQVARQTDRLLAGILDGCVGEMFLLV